MTKKIELGLSNPLIELPLVHSRHSDDDTAIGDAAGGLSYVFTEELVLALNAALATRRPLLLRGAPGSGKSSLARAVAEADKRGLLTKVVSSDSKLDDLLWRYDYVRRLQDASTPGKQLKDYEYVEPQALWWALAPRSAMGRGKAGREGQIENKLNPPDIFKSKPPVLLLDEIDKADPALPNDLLVALGEGRFVIRETGEAIVAEHFPLIMITTNDERELSRPFLRRCIVAQLPERNDDELIEWFTKIGVAHFPKERTLAEAVARYLVKGPPDGSVPPPRDERPSAAELVDLLRTCVKLGIQPQHPRFQSMQLLVAAKPRAALES